MLWEGKKSSNETAGARDVCLGRHNFVGVPVALAPSKEENGQELPIYFLNHILWRKVC